MFPGDIGDVVVQLTSGRYVLGCVRRGWTGHRHASRGEAKVLVVTNATPVAGVARLSPGGVAYLPVELTAGDYVVYCLITDPKSERRHVELGMFRAITVDERVSRDSLL
ncbi:MAG: hypothetical protein ACRENH_17360 [Gemmatimonadaceae bacterium]